MDCSSCTDGGVCATQILGLHVETFTISVYIPTDCMTLRLISINQNVNAVFKDFTTVENLAPSHLPYSLKTEHVTGTNVFYQ